MRCLALAQAWQDTGQQAMFITAMESPILEGRLKSEGMEVYQLSEKPGSEDDAKETTNLVRQKGGSWLVLDGYHFDTGFQEILKESELRFLFMDDYGHCRHYLADVVVNQNIQAHESFYKDRESYTRLLLGTPYALLRREFLNWRGWRRETPRVAQKILVTLGGSDPDNVTLKVIQAIRLIETPGMEVNVVAGPTNPNMEMIEKELSTTLPIFRLRSAPEDMPALMAWADLVVSAAGSTVWELAFMGLPGVLLVVAQNQRGAAKKLQEKEVFSVLEFEPHWSPQDLAQFLAPLVQGEHLRLSMSQNARLLVDGLGASRVVQVMLGF
jgi:UDP-2,4-diacetamido-2,4,6-trideoxy-beta-L-altropyranose hydrolase